MAEPIHGASAGRRVALVTIEHRTLPASGFPVETWAPLITLGMEKIDLLGSEQYRADQMTARYDVRFIGPYAPALDPETVDVPATQRLRHRGQVYDITNAAVLAHFSGIEYRAMTATQTEP